MAASQALTQLCDLASEPTNALVCWYFDRCAELGSPSAEGGAGRGGKDGREEKDSGAWTAKLMANQCLQVLGLLSARATDDKEACRLVQQEMHAHVATTDDALRARHGLGCTEIVLAGYKCMDSEATPGSLVLTSSCLLFDPASAAGSSCSSGTQSEQLVSKPVVRAMWRANLRDIAVVDRVQSKMTSLLDNPLRVELRGGGLASDVMFLGFGTKVVDELFADIAAQCRKLGLEIRLPVQAVAAAVGGDGAGGAGGFGQQAGRLGKRLSGLFAKR